MKRRTVFGGSRVVLDAMVIINFHNLLILDEFLAAWARGEVVVHQYVMAEAQRSAAGPLDWPTYLRQSLVFLEELCPGDETESFFSYCDGDISGTRIHKGEAACLALALSRGYGLACDERIVREEFNRRAPRAICINSWGIVRKAAEIGFITTGKRGDLLKGLFYS